MNPNETENKYIQLDISGQEQKINFHFMIAQLGLARWIKSILTRPLDVLLLPIKSFREDFSVEVMD